MRIKAELSGKENRMDFRVHPISPLHPVLRVLIVVIIFNQTFATINLNADVLFLVGRNIKRKSSERPKFTRFPVQMVI